ncbi:hypothetical protein NDU88_002852 [Pleurodeles waltl]|uniref:Uncharacterized protein n=1 Tax=Pleurodeles waltl TaxID=8319 RepID=A0AAV7UAG0_PLEWA|nr:hypothetical protein NDU88_002852 [Pleurodeles waltl]
MFNSTAERQKRPQEDATACLSARASVTQACGHTGLPQVRQHDKPPNPQAPPGSESRKRASQPRWRLSSPLLPRVRLTPPSPAKAGGHLTAQSRLLYRSEGGHPHHACPPSPLCPPPARNTSHAAQPRTSAAHQGRASATTEPAPTDPKKRDPVTPGSTRLPPDPKERLPRPWGASGSREDIAGDGSALEARPIGHVPWPRPHCLAS